jgi:hypothetical protein
MEGIKTPRPLTHDLFTSFAHAFGIQLLEVYIYKFENGIFSSELTFSDGERQIVIDSRTSDAIAIAMRTGSPIYTTKKILDETGFVMEVQSAAENAIPNSERLERKTRAKADISNYTITELEQKHAQLIEQEKYEDAAKVNNILKAKRQNGEA